MKENYHELWNEQARSSGTAQAAIGKATDKDLKSQSELFIRLAEGLENKEVLDAGCGYGRLIEEFSRHTKKIVGIDVSAEMLSVAKKEVDSALIKGSVTALPFIDEVFRIVVSDRVLMHITKEDLRNALQEFRRVLKPRSFLLFSVPFLLSSSGLKWEAKRRIARILYFNNPRKAAFWRAIAARNFTKNSVRKILKETDFQVDRILVIRDSYSTHLFVKAFRAK